MRGTRSSACARRRLYFTALDRIYFARTARGSGYKRLDVAAAIWSQISSDFQIELIETSVLTVYTATAKFRG